MARLGKRATGESHRQKQVFVPGGHLMGSTGQRRLTSSLQPILRGGSEVNNFPTTGLATDALLATKAVEEKKQGLLLHGPSDR